MIFLARQFGPLHIKLSTCHPGSLQWFALDKVACLAEETGNSLYEILINEQLTASDVLQLEPRFVSSVTDFVIRESNNNRSRHSVSRLLLESVCYWNVQWRDGRELLTHEFNDGFLCIVRMFRSGFITVSLRCRFWPWCWLQACDDQVRFPFISF